PYTNKAFETLKGDHEYVMLIPHYRLDEDGEIEFDEEGNPVIDGLGSEEDWEGLEDIVKGKIAVVSRGTLSFIDKCENAVMAGAVGVIIYNNQPGVIYMDLSDYTQTAPAVTISQYDGALLMNTADEFSEDGTYCTGKLSVHEAAVIKDYIEGDVISDFSSWGVPGSLEMKPEIAAPGGNIYSVDGEWAETDKYVSMSGTSMASPQVAGMAAVAAQYVREKGLEKKTSLSARALIQSLLMSTARPMTDEDGYYYSVLQQGAGLANIGSAVNADSYILMDKDANAGAADGKVKAELGDDPKKTGSYTFGFTLYNLTNTEKKYDLSADFFTQAVVDAGRYSPLYVQAKFTDFLEGTTRFDCGDTAVVPANGSKHVTVTFTLDAEMKEYLNEAYPSGAYIEGYVFAEGQGTDSEVTTAHSIPVLGFYGNWSTASMFDKGSYEDYYLAETEDRMPYLSAAYAEGYEEQSLLANSFGVTYEGGDGPYPLGGNPYIDYLFEEYDPDRNAVNGETSLLSLVQFAPIRNAADSKFIIYNETTKETILETSLGAVSSAYYHTNAGRWYNTALSFAPNYDFAGVKEGDKLTFTFALAPEYYQDAEGNVRWKDVDMTNALSMSVVVDNTKPEIVAEPELEGDTLSLTVKDNQHIAAILLTNKSGSKVYAIAGSDENAKIGEEYKVDINVAGINSDGLYVQVVDYANNITTVKVDEKFGEGTILPNRIAYDCEPFVNYWVAFNGTDVTIDDLVHGYERSDYNINAATIVDHIVFAVDVNNQLITMPDFDFVDVTEVINFSKFFEDPIAVLDMAYNEKDGKIYMLIARAEGYDLGAER
ncbi:MAG: S8 family serine peptidase, partial [Ruminiclostridium sp.]|nr:S8 family serine peptidase [Ruminiclostridium sp.]